MENKKKIYKKPTIEHREKLSVAAGSCDQTTSDTCSNVGQS